MLNKQEMCDIISELIKIEESVIPIYSEHIKNTLFLSGFDKNSQSEVKNILEILRIDSEKHKSLCENLLNKIKESGKNVY